MNSLGCGAIQKEVLTFSIQQFNEGPTEKEISITYNIFLQNKR